MKDLEFSKSLFIFIGCLLMGMQLAAQEANPNIAVENVVVVNTNKLDFSPTFYRDGIVFVSNRKRPKSARKITDNKDEWLGDNFMSLYYAPKTADGLDIPQEFSVNITTRYHEGPVAFSKDGNRIFFTRNNYENGQKKTNRKGDTLLKIYTAVRNGEDWTSIAELPFNVDEYDQCHPTLSADGRVLVFSSNREGGKGGMDLYKSEFLNGQWSAPINLGPQINTSQNEVFPYVHDDGKLYFASNGHGGYGGLDVLVAKKMNSTWASPTNIGSPINSIDDDFGYILEASGKGGYFSSSRRSGLGKDDIYQFSIATPEPTKTEEVFTEKGLRKIIAGTVSDGVSGDRLGKVKVSLVNRVTGQRMSTFSDDKGEFAFRSSPIGEGYALQVSKEGYNAYAEDLNLRQLATDTRAIKEYFFLLNPVGSTAPPPVPVAVPVVNTPAPVAEAPNAAMEEVITFKEGLNTDLKLGTKLVLDEILFEYGSYDLQITSLPILDKVATLLNQHSKLGIELSAHTDSRGNASYNERLSRRRAESVVTYLVQQGIQPNRLIPIGSGESNVRNGCIDGVPCSEEQHRSNRRIEMKMIQMLGY